VFFTFSEKRHKRLLQAGRDVKCSVVKFHECFFWLGTI